MAVCGSNYFDTNAGISKLTGMLAGLYMVCLGAACQGVAFAVYVKLGGWRQGNPW